MPKPPPPTKPWPRLSDELTHDRNPCTCQACGMAVAPTAREVWIECDHDDQPTNIVVVLCPRCARRVIEPHPRLYRQMDTNAPHPGTMLLCYACVNRHGLECVHPDAKTNGGPGMAMVIDPPFTGHVTCSPRSKSYNFTTWPKQATACEGRVGGEAKRTTPKTDLFQ